MTFSLQKYWHDIVAPMVRQEPPPTVPQAVVLHEQQVLLVQRDTPRLWELPGGGILPGEHPETTVLREVQEETGVCVEIVELLGWYERTGFRAHRAPVYLCHPVGGHLRPQEEEAVTVRFFSLQALPRGLFPWYRPILHQDLVSLEPRPLQRTQHLGIGMVLRCLALDLGNRLQVGDTAPYGMSKKPTAPQ